jgi:predicted transcriptional regulator
MPEERSVKCPARRRLSQKAFEAAVEEGRADVRAGRLVDHDEVVGEIERLLAPKRVKAAPKLD